VVQLHEYELNKNAREMVSSILWHNTRKDNFLMQSNCTSSSSSQDNIPYGYCHCGCGQKTNLVKWSDANKGLRRGEPNKFVTHHQNRTNNLRQEKEAPEKFCSQCKTTKKADDFYRMKSGYLRPICKVCTVENSLQYQKNNRPLYAELARKSRSEKPKENFSYALKYRYGITADQYEQLLDRQGGRCAICDKTPTNKRLSVDHDHETGEVRGLLCSNCNHLLGLAQDSIDTLNKAIGYLVSSEAQNGA